ncbi:hypothetical protein IWQ62_006090 [Dispira parvispora]|uniref:SNARE-complex protein Syntaxin-18 N-terminal domain-containing protein n=1 Tax=Dispira parvispora TaxID=1520584 RepID=A0A9W8E4M6_9FUNG|nr:hypothetical protein IWQ62_006090 [Dispira parvispora]
MADITTTFRSIIHRRQADLGQDSTDSSKEKVTLSGASSPISPTSPTTVNAPKDPFTQEGYRVLHHINGLHQFLWANRHAYLNIGVAKKGDKLHYPNKFGDTAGKTGEETIDLSSCSLSSTGFPRGQRTNISTLTDAQRDEIDQQSKVIIRQCMERIKRLEVWAKTPPVVDKAGSLFGLFTMAKGSQYDTLKQETLAAHHGAITWYLNKRLMDVSAFQRQQQEFRLNRELEKQQHVQPRRTGLYWKNKPAFTEASTPGGLTSANTSSSASPSSNVRRSSSSIVRDDENSSHSDTDDEGRQRQRKYQLRNTEPKRTSATMTPDLIDAIWESSPVDSSGKLEGSGPGLPDSSSGDNAQQYHHQMELQEENRALLQEFEDTLTQVRQTEQALLEISALQSALSTHLAVQTQETERLHAEAIATTERVQQGNEQLLQARQRNADTRKWILFFLIMASLILLFLDWFD